MIFLLIRPLVLVCLFLLPGSLPLQAQEDLPRFEINRQGEGIIARELRKNRTWPHQDMAYRLQSRGDISGAARELRAYLAIDPLDDNVRLQLIVLLDRLGEDQEIIQEAGRILETRPDEPLPLLYRAWALERLGLLDQARADLKLALKLPPNMASGVPGLSPEKRREIVVTLTNWAMAEGDFAQALAVLDALPPEDVPPTAGLIRGYALSGLGDHGRAMEALEQAALQAATRQMRDQALGAAAEEAVRLGRHDRARDLLLQVADERKPDPKLEIRLAELARSAGLAGEAVEHYRRAVDLGAGTDHDDLVRTHLARTHLAQVLFNLGRLHEAEEQAVILAQTAKLEERLRALVMLGVIRERLGDYPGAAQAFEQAAQYDLTPESWTTLGALALKEEQFDLAARHYEQAWLAGGRTDFAMAEMVAAYWLRAGRIDQAITVSLDLGHYPGFKPRERLRALESAAHLQRQAGRPEQAALTLLTAADLPDMDAETKTDLLDRAGTMFLEGGGLGQAAKVLRRLLENLAPGPERAEILVRLARLEELQALPGWPERAVTLLTQAEIQPGLPPKQAALMAERSAAIFIALDERVRALQALERAVIQGGENPFRMLELGHTLASLELHHRARDAFARAAELDAGDMAWIGLARTYERLGQPGLALHSLQQARFMRAERADLSELPGGERFPALTLLGYLHEELGRPDQAVYWYEQALEMENVSEIRYRLARSSYALGNTQRADEILRTVELANFLVDLPAEEQLSAVMLAARIARSQDRLDEAEEVYRRALALAQHVDQDLEQDLGHGDERVAEVWFELGQVLRRQEDREAAAAAFAQASCLHPAPAVLMAEGYELLSLERLEDAQPLLTEAALHEPDLLLVHQDLGYVAMQLGDNDLAVSHFMDAIDNAPLRPVDDEDQARALAEDVRRMRGEVRALTNALDLDFWLTYTSGKTGTLESGRSGGLAAPGRDVIRTSSGIELGWIPPNWGFQDHRIFKLIGRLAWNLEPDSVNVIDDTWEAALGLRYKPLKDYNFNLGLERLFSLSGRGEDNWVARFMLSLSDGMDDVHPFETFWNYSFLFGEVDAYLESPSRLAAYVEARQGLSWKLRDNLILSPFLVADAKWWSNSRADDVSFYEGGVGLSARYLYDEDKYALPRKSVELLLTYKLGRIFDTDNIKDDRINALFATLLFRF